MAEVTRPTFISQKDSDYADQTNELITALIHRETFQDIADSAAFKNMTESITGTWTFNNVVVGAAVPTLGTHFTNKTYVDGLVASGNSTGISYGGITSINADTAKFDVTAGSGYIYSDATSATGSSETVTWTAKTAQVVTGGDGITYLYLASNNDTIVQTSVAPTRETRRTRIYLGRLIVSGGVIVAAEDDRDFIRQGISQLRDMSEAIGKVKLNGLVVTANGANLLLDHSAGTFFDFGNNGQSDPHTKDISVNTGFTFRYRTQSTDEGGDITAIDPNNYDVGGVVTAMTNNKFQIQEIILFTSGNIRIQYGQNQYSTLEDAKAAIATRTFTQNPASADGTRIAYLIVQDGATDLSNASSAVVITTNKFGELGGGVTVNAGALIAANNLSDVVTPATALANLGGAALTGATFSGEVAVGDGQLTVNNSSTAVGALVNLDFSNTALTDADKRTVVLRAVNEGGSTGTRGGAFEMYLREASSGSTFIKPFSISNSGDATFSNDVTAADFILSSDERKKDIHKIIGGEEIEYIEYNYKGSDKTRFGVSAQQVQKVIPEVVHTDAEGMLSVSYIDLLIKQIASLEARVKELEK